MAGDAFQVSVDIDDVSHIMDGFRALDVSLQKKYLGAAVRAAAKDKIPSLKAATPRFRGSLRKSVGVALTKSVAKPWELGAGGGVAVARLGYRRGKTQKGKTYGGAHAWLLEEGVSERRPKTRQAFRIRGRSIKKYAYLQSLKMGTTLSGKGAAVFLAKTKPVRGTGDFGDWCDSNLPSILAKLKGSLEGYLVKAKAEGQRRANRAASAKARRYAKKLFYAP